MTAFRTLLAKETLRFWKVAMQTVAAPVLTSLLYLVIFGYAFTGRVQVYDGVSYASFLVPGLVMMSVLQNAFANSSSSLIQSKITGNIVFILLPPISYFEFFAAYVLASVVRGVVVGAGVLIVTVWFVELRVVAPVWVLAFALLGSALLGALGLIAGIVAEKIDQLAAFQNFFILLPPISHLQFFSAYVLGAVVRGLVVGAGVLAVTVWFVELRLHSPLWVLGFALLGAALLGSLGLIAGICSDKIDQIAAFQNFLVLPLTFLSGVFYSIQSLPAFWQRLSHANPFFYMVDGFRYGFFGASDFPPAASLAVVSASFLVVSFVTLWLLQSGYKLRN